MQTESLDMKSHDVCNLLSIDPEKKNIYSHI